MAENKQKLLSLWLICNFLFSKKLIYRKAYSLTESSVRLRRLSEMSQSPLTKENPYKIINNSHPP